MIVNFNLPEGKLSSEVRRCLINLYATRAGSQPLDREFGLSWDMLDKPFPVAKNELAVEIIQKTKKYEPRVEIEEVAFESEPNNGILCPTVYLKWGEYYD